MIVLSLFLLSKEKEGKKRGSYKLPFVTIARQRSQLKHWNGPIQILVALRDK